MPELPEVENFKKYIDKTSLNKKIKEVDVVNTTMLINQNKKELLDNLKGKVFLSTYRHGKYLFIQLQNGGYLLLHFGMSGYLEYQKGNKELQEYSLLVTFEDNSSLSFTDKRKLGKMGFIKDVQQFIKEKDYGPDALQISKEQFLEIVKNKQGNIKSVLMAQQLIAGIGNEYSDEILFQAGIDPESKTLSLSDKMLLTIFKKMQDVLQQAILNISKNVRQHFFVENRKAGLPCPSGCGGITEVKKIGGRSSYFCPDCQQLIK